MSGTIPTITCEVFGEKLMDFLEGDLDGATRAAMEAHARRCAACGALLADLRHIAHDAAALPALTPSRDLWSGIAPRLDAPVVPIAARRPMWKSPRLLGIAAAAAIVFAAVLGYQAARRTAPAAVAPAAQMAQIPAAAHDSPAAATLTPATSAAPAPAAASPASNGARLAANRAATATPAAVEKSYDGEIAGLRAIIDQRRGHVDSATVAVLERNLSVIDSAIAQCKSALAKDPDSEFLLQSLNQSLDTKVQLMRMTAGLPSTT